MSDTARIVACPTCKATVKWTSQNPYRPFCSERCKLIDLGAWADMTSEGNTPMVLLEWGTYRAANNKAFREPQCKYHQRKILPEKVNLPKGEAPLKASQLADKTAFFDIAWKLGKGTEDDTRYLVAECVCDFFNGEYAIAEVYFVLPSSL